MPTPPKPRPLPRRRAKEVVRLSGPPALVQAIPYLVGFVPHRSVVVIALAGRRHRVVMTVRVDLDADPTSALAPAWRSAAEHQATGVVVAVYDTAIGGHPLPWRALVKSLLTAAAGHGLEAVDALGVARDRFWSYVCQDLDCCPGEGRMIDHQGAVAAEMVVNGLSQVPRRDDLLAEVAPDPERAQRVADAVGRLPEPTASPAARCAAGVALLDSLVRRAPGACTDPAEAAAALVALTDLRVRDSQLVPRRDRDGERAGRLWAELARSAPTGLRAAPLVLLALQQFRDGQGARANVALEAAVSDQPGYTLAHLIDQAISAAFAPAQIDQTLREAVATVRRDIRRQDRPSRSRGSLSA